MTLNSEELALKDKFLSRCKRPDWTEQDFKSVLISNRYALENLFYTLSDIAHMEGFTREQLDALSARFTAILTKVQTEIASREVRVSAFKVNAIKPLARASLKAVDAIFWIGFGFSVGLLVAQWL